ncbi:MAG: hypothetical protein WDN69_14885 [Aliidongia sp.]
MTPCRFLEAAVDTIEDVQILKFFAYRRVFAPAFDAVGSRVERRIAALLGAGEAAGDAPPAAAAAAHDRLSLELFRRPSDRPCDA